MDSPDTPGSPVTSPDADLPAVQCMSPTVDCSPNTNEQPPVMEAHVPPKPRLQPLLPQPGANFTLLETDADILPIDLRAKSSAQCTETSATLRETQISRLHLTIRTSCLETEESSMQTSDEPELENNLGTAASEFNVISAQLPFDSTKLLLGVQKQESKVKPKVQKRKNRRPLYQPWKWVDHSAEKASSSSSEIPVSQRSTTHLSFDQRSSIVALRAATRTLSQRQTLQNIMRHLRTKLIPLVSVTTGEPHPDFPTSIMQYHLLTHNQLDSLARWYHQTLDGGRERWLYPVAIERVWILCRRHRHSRPGKLCPCLRQLNLNVDGRSQDYRVDSQDMNMSDDYVGPSLATKRRRFGRFIGLRGCESPVDSNFGIEAEFALDAHKETTKSTTTSTQDTQSAAAATATALIVLLGRDLTPITNKDINNDQNHDQDEDRNESDEEEKEDEDVSARMEREWQKALRRAEEEKQAREKMWRGWY